MPSPELATALQSTLKALTDVTAGRTTFASNLVTLLNAAFGASNPFGTAATRDTGTAAGNVPVIGGSGTLDSAVLPDADADNPGAVLLARGLDDSRANAVVRPEQVRSAVSGLTQGLRASTIAQSTLALNAAFTTPGAGFIIASSGGAGGANSDGQDGGDGEAMTIQYGAASASAFSASSPTMTTPGGSDTLQPSFLMLAIDSAARTANRAPKFAFVRGGQGARGGRSGYINTTKFPPQSGHDGNLLIAFIDRAGVIVRMTADGTGGTGRSGAQRGQSGANGFAVFVRVE